MKKISFNVAWPFTVIEVRELLSFAFQVSLISFLSFHLIEFLHTGIVTTFFSTNIFLWAAIITGVLTTVWPMVVPEVSVEKRQSWKDYVWMFILTLGTVVLVWYKTYSIGLLAKVFAPLSGLIVLGLSLFISFDKDDK